MQLVIMIVCQKKQQKKNLCILFDHTPHWPGRCADEVSDAAVVNIDLTADTGVVVCQTFISNDILTVIIHVGWCSRKSSRPLACFTQQLPMNE